VKNFVKCKSCNKHRYETCELYMSKKFDPQPANIPTTKSGC